MTPVLNDTALTKLYSMHESLRLNDIYNIILKSSVSMQLRKKKASQGDEIK